MIDTWFISDTHFGHKNILEYEKEARPFSTIEEMHEVIIERWNRVVKPNDVIYHLGDFAFGKRWVAIAERLHGKKRLIMGNHDTYPSNLYLNYFEKLYGCVFWNRCILSHMPVHSNGLGARWLINVHGHLHSGKVMTQKNDIFHMETTEGTMEMYRPFGHFEDENYFNVSCEQNNLTPIHADIIRDRIKEIS